MAHCPTVTEEPCDGLHPIRHIDILHGVQGLPKVVLSQLKLLFGNPPVVKDLSYFFSRNGIASTNLGMKPSCEQDPGQKKGKIAVPQILFPVPEIVEALEACKKPVLGFHKGC